MAKVFGVKITTPLIQINTPTPSVAGQVWTANDTVGNGSWQAASGGTVTTSAPVTVGKHTKWASATSLTDSLLSESGITITVSGNLTITGTFTSNETNNNQCLAWMGL